MSAWSKIKSTVEKHTSDPSEELKSTQALFDGEYGQAYDGLVDRLGIGKQVGEQLGMSNDKQKKKMKEAEALKEEENLATRGVLDKMNKTDSDYLKKIKELENQASKQASDARFIYSNDINPRLKGVMEDAYRDSRSAMTLEEAGNVNNYMHQQVRDLYESEAQKVRRQALADQGVLTAMGQQNMARQMGAAGAPLTGAQLQLMQATNMNQAGLAFNNAQVQMNRLREQGLDRGFTESAAQYERGQRSLDRYERSIGSYEDAMNRDIMRQRMFRDELGGYAGIGYGVNQGSNMRDLGYVNQVYGGKQDAISNAIAMANADNAGKSALLSGIMGAGGAAIGGYFGGPQGAQAGQAAGSALGGSGYQAGQGPQPQQSQRPNYYDGSFYGGYGQQQPQRPYQGYA